MPNAFAHIELTTVDLKAAKTFYGKVFAWKLTDMPGMPYTMIDVGGGTGGGMQPKPMPEAPTGWMPYVQVESVKKTVSKAQKAGATVLLPFQAIGEMGAIGVFADPQGAVIGIWEAGPSAKPAETPSAAETSSPAAKKAAKKVAKKPAPAAKKASKKSPAKPAPPAKKVAKKAPAKKQKK